MSVLASVLVSGRSGFLSRILIRSSRWELSHEQVMQCATHCSGQELTLHADSCDSDPDPLTHFIRLHWAIHRNSIKKLKNALIIRQSLPLPGFVSKGWKSSTLYRFSLQPWCFDQPWMLSSQWTPKKYSKPCCVNPQIQYFSTAWLSSILLSPVRNEADGERCVCPLMFSCVKGSFEINVSSHLSLCRA